MGYFHGKDRNVICVPRENNHLYDNRGSVEHKGQIVTRGRIHEGHIVDVTRKPSQLKFIIIHDYAICLLLKH